MGILVRSKQEVRLSDIITVLCSSLLGHLCLTQIVSMEVILCQRLVVDEISTKVIIWHPIFLHSIFLRLELISSRLWAFDCLNCMYVCGIYPSVCVIQ